MKRTKLVWVGMLCASAAVGAQTDCTAKDSNVEFIFAKYRGTPRLTDCRDLDLHDAVYDPSTKTLKLDFTPGPNAALAVDGKPVEIGTSGERRTIEIKR